MGALVYDLLAIWSKQKSKLKWQKSLAYLYTYAGSPLIIGPKVESLVYAIPTMWRFDNTVSAAAAKNHWKALYYSNWKIHVVIVILCSTFSIVQLICQLLLLLRDLDFFLAGGGCSRRRWCVCVLYMQHSLVILDFVSSIRNIHSSSTTYTYMVVLFYPDISNFTFWNVKI